MTWAQLMFPLSFCDATSDYILLEPWDWERLSPTASWLQGFEVLDRWHAEIALDEIAASCHGRELLRRLAPEVLLGFHPGRFAPGSYAFEREEEEMIGRLRDEALGTPFSEHDKPPHMADLYICRRKHVARAPTRPPNPWQHVHEAMEVASQAPRGFVSVQTVTEAGEPIANVRIELLLADGELLRRSTDAQGQLHLESVPQGRCTIRVPTLDGNAWHAAEGGASSQIERGHKQLHIVNRGENLTRIAQRYGIKGWRVLWDAPDNAKLRKTRRNPHALWPGDEVIIPAIAVHEITRPTDQLHRLVLSEELVEFRVVLQDHNQQPFASEAYELRVDEDLDSAPRKGSTDGSGKVVERVSSSVERVELALPELGLRWTFALCDFVERPSDEADARQGDERALTQAVKAAQLRLNALGFPCGDADGRLGPKTLEALELSGQPADLAQERDMAQRALAALDHLEPMFARTV